MVKALVSNLFILNWISRCTRSHHFFYLASIISSIFALLIHGAIPFLTMPTLQQALGKMGFAESLSTGSVVALHATHFGFPEPVALSFGLSATLPATLLLRTGLNSGDAYTIIVAFWVLIGMRSAYAICRHYKCERRSSLLLSLIWITSPIIYKHAGYSMLSLGMALLPFYFLCAINLALKFDHENRAYRFSVFFYGLGTLISVFMDGYTFVMFSVGATIYFLRVLQHSEKRFLFMKRVLPVHILSFFVSYLLFRSYIGQSDFVRSPISFFRGWGVDVSFLYQPTKGVLWFPDFVGYSVARSSNEFFGDASVWLTTFALPTITLGGYAWLKARRLKFESTGFMIIALFSLYMALGPSFKFNSTKSVGLNQEAGMPAEAALFPTGSAYISENLPGFNQMRSSYRWLALAILALWLLIVIWSETEYRKRRVTVLLCILLLLQVPNFGRHWKEKRDNMRMFDRLENELIPAFNGVVKPEELVLFAPWRNDLLANYLAPRLAIKTFNVGGDKQLAKANRSWPSDVLALAGELEPSDAPTFSRILQATGADVIVVPFFDLLWSGAVWPCFGKGTSSFPCPSARRDQLSRVIEALELQSELIIHETELFMSVRLLESQAKSSEIHPEFDGTLSLLNFPIENRMSVANLSRILSDGWHAPECHHVWSDMLSKLHIEIPDACQVDECLLDLDFGVFGASPDRQVNVLISYPAQNGRAVTKIVSQSDDLVQVGLPLPKYQRYAKIQIVVDGAVSPLVLTGSPDPRVLGVSLQKLNIRRALPSE